ncbi:pyruvate formate-lyase-activating protein [Atopobium fossor]|uniref:pyruvate formate-lyase-activating protein n=1 Tax=Atopobium fossor TaxID=39487 RepID=UPI0004176A42|nr:pyruvate formate-lyase-activating protein [Atopobium fossor]
MSDISDNNQNKDPLTSCGWVHSVESFGTVDGPGCRMVVFMQGCPMRCAYCHNPDSWEFNTGTRVSVADLLTQFERNRPFYKSGGLTVSGGEPLMQAGFVADLFEKAHQARAGKIHTCLDSSGFSFNPHNTHHYQQISRLLDNCDMVLLDIKHSDQASHMDLCGQPIDDPLAFGDELAQRKIPVVIRHVVVPGITDTDEELAGVGRIIAQWDNVVGLDILPYHTMGKSKYEQLGLLYKLEGVPAMDPNHVPGIRQKILRERARVRAVRAAH